MILDRETNTLFFSKKITENHKEDWNRIRNSINVNFHLLDQTNDIWVRDFMPIQIDDKRFVSFSYLPSYLKNDPELITNQKEVCQFIGIDPVYSSIKIDGGNIVKGKNRVIILDRIFQENSESTPHTLVKEIEKLLEAEVLIFPTEKDDFLGHADGMLRFMDDSIILINELKVYPRNIRILIERAMISNNLDYIEIPCKPERDEISAKGFYINFLEFGNFIYLPTFDDLEKVNEEAIATVSRIFPDRTIIPILLTTIAKEGGLLNCISWSCFSSNHHIREAI
ncbi:agmatine deiminase family protein [Leptospira levettii]|uniref:agmatine deiminase family protein n=1 Tax=Leptospira levettii TaxID=2023178 RepID=UPI000C295A33|nr:agmatine deiminase family protein [Leptospira levettii]PJZ89046.1 hypothetical protein CH368_08450 [Leptospira levettii]